MEFNLVGALEHLDYFSIYWECHHPNWRTPWFFRGVGTPPTRNVSAALVNITQPDLHFLVRPWSLARLVYPEGSGKLGRNPGLLLPMGLWLRVIQQSSPQGDGRSIFGSQRDFASPFTHFWVRQKFFPSSFHGLFLFIFTVMWLKQ